MLQGSLAAPWDAVWLTERWPELFQVTDIDRGLVTVIDVQGVLKLAHQTDALDLDFDGEGLTLHVHGYSTELVAA